LSQGKLSYPFWNKNVVLCPLLPGSPIMCAYKK